MSSHYGETPHVTVPSVRALKILARRASSQEAFVMEARR